MSNTTTFTAYLPSRSRSIAREIETRKHGSYIDTSYHLDNCERRINRQSRHLDYLNNVYLNNIDTCDKYYRYAHTRELELGEKLFETKNYFAARGISNSSRFKYRY